MLIAERHRFITDAVASRRFVRTEEIAEELDVSLETVRRDFISLEKDNLLVRVHGGAAAVETGDEPPFHARATADSARKQQIGRAAAALLDGSMRSAFIDLGTTALASAREISPSFTGSITTSSLHVAAHLADHTAATVYLTGGRVRPGDLSLSGTNAAEQLSDVFFDIALVGSGGLHHEVGLSDYDIDEAAVRRVAIANARQVWALVDSSKFDKVARTRVCDLAALTGIVTDEPPTADLRAALDEAGVLIRTSA